MKRIILFFLIASLLLPTLAFGVSSAPDGLGEYIISTSSLNVRSGPSASSERLGNLRLGDKANVTEISNGYWGRIIYNGDTAWISLNYAVRCAAKQLSTSQAGIDLIKRLEGYSKYAYKDYSQWSIGYGTACEENEYPDGITEPEAEALLIKAVSVYEIYLDTFLNKYSVELTQPQYDALVSFTYNLGNVWVREKDFALRDILISGAGASSGTEIRNAFSEFVSAGGEVLEGLVTRRKLEADMFISGTSFFVGSFTDVKHSAWYADEVEFCLERGYMKGVSDTRFSPNTNVTREQFVLILANMAGVDTDEYKDINSGMTDVPTGKWYSGAVTWSVESGYVKGVAEGVFGRGQPIQRAALARLLYVYAEANGADMSARAELGAFGDHNTVAHENNAWMVAPLEWAVANGIISGISSDGVTYLSPKATATRAQTARMLMQFDALL